MPSIGGGAAASKEEAKDYAYLAYQAIKMTLQGKSVLAPG